MSNDNEHFYEINIEWKNGRIGTMSSPKLDGTMDVATPPEFPGGVEGVWSPEHLFTAAVSSCFMTSFTAVAEFSKFEFEDLNVHSSGKMSRDEEGKFVMSDIAVKAELTIRDESKEKKAIRLLKKAEQICLITRSIKSKVTLEPIVIVKQPV